jgi:hypothetical protein
MAGELGWLHAGQIVDPQRQMIRAKGRLSRTVLLLRHSVSQSIT